MKINPAKVAAKLVRADIKRIEGAIRVGVIGGLSVDEIVRLVCGTEAMNGRDGLTEITRQHVTLLAKQYLKGDRHHDSPK
jgi:hypothetical protein